MFAASSSRAASRAVSVRAFSTSSSAQATRRVVVELLRDVPGLGQKADLVAVLPGRARQQLVPTGNARWVPWKGGRERPQPYTAPRTEPEAAIPIETAPMSRTPAGVLSALRALPPTLTFERKTVSADTPALHGSVTLQDVAALLAAEHGLAASDVEVSWATQPASARVKELGSWEAVVRVRGLGEEAVEVEVETVRAE